MKSFLPVDTRTILLSTSLLGAMAGGGASVGGRCREGRALKSKMSGGREKAVRAVEDRGRSAQS
jgi:hypothetical protein